MLSVSKRILSRTATVLLRKLEPAAPRNGCWAKPCRVQQAVIIKRNIGRARFNSSQFVEPYKVEAFNGAAGRKIAQKAKGQKSQRKSY